ncbi:MAG TPA: L-rhamnose/proton symporter RhaT, partial [Pseudomonadales bacterium]|nr:L-rhamnose/proton symporter RhaT [Pseudomonadales bacterium]
AIGQFSLGKGLLLSLVAGVLSAVYGIALAKGEPIADVAALHGAGVFRGNVVYIFSNTGAFLTTAIYCLWLHMRHKTLGELVELPAGPEKASLPMNFSLAVLTGFLWYGQFFFYNLGHVRLGEKFAFTSWAIHMIMLVLFSNLVGLLLREWFGCRRITKSVLGMALVILVAAVLLLTYGNKVGG